MAIREEKIKRQNSTSSYIISEEIKYKIKKISEWINQQFHKKKTRESRLLFKLGIFNNTLNEQNWGAATGAHFVMGKGHSSCGKCLLSETKQLFGI